MLKSEIQENGIKKDIYAAILPKDNSVVYSEVKQCFVYQYKDENGKSTYVDFTLDVATSDSKESLNQMTNKDFKQYTVGKGVYERENEDRIIVLNADSVENQNLSLVMILDDGTFLKSETNEAKEKEDSFLSKVWNKLGEFGIGIADGVVDKLSEIMNDLLLTIADGIQSLIDMVMKSERVTVRDVIFGKLPQLSIDFWNASSLTNSNMNSGEGSGEGSGEKQGEGSNLSIDTPPVSALKEIVSYWYDILRKIAIAIYLVMLLYIGVRILLASTGKGARQYKDSLTSWLVGVVILLFFPIVMRYIVAINQSFVEMLDTNVVQINSGEKGREDDAMLAIRNMAESYGNLALTIVYIIMLGQLVVLLGVYYKRVIVVAFLITIFPIVATLYIWEKTNRGRAKALGTWAKEFTILVFTQTFHAVVYVILIDGAYSAFMQTGGENWLLFVLSVTFLFQAEKIIRAIFGMRSTANTIGDLASTGAAVWMTSKTVKNMFKRNKNGNKQDDEDLDDAADDVKEAKNKQMTNQVLANTVANSGMIIDEAERANNNTNGIPNSTPSENPMENLAAAQAVVTEEGLKGKTKKNMITKALSATGRTVVGGTARAAGITLGVTSGLATGSVKSGIANAVVFNEMTGMVADSATKLVGVAHGAFAGQVMKVKVRSGAMDDKLREAGFDLDAEFDPDPIISSKKAEIIREALAQQMAATRSGGKAKGEYKFIKSVDKQRRRKS